MFTINCDNSDKRDTDGMFWKAPERPQDCVLGVKGRLYRGKNSSAETGRKGNRQPKYDELMEL